MTDFLGLLVLVIVAFIAGHHHGYGQAMRYCTRRLQEEIDR